MAHPMGHGRGEALPLRVQIEYRNVHWIRVEGAYHYTLLEDAMLAETPLAAALLQRVNGRSRRA